jgi:ZIP family zinc transporter
VPTVLEAAFWGFVGGSSLLLGAVAGLMFPTSQRVIGLIMAFGSGVLISALAFELTEEAFVSGGADAVAIGLAAGSLAFFVGDWVIDHRGGNHRKRSSGQAEKSVGTAIVLGTLLDGIPESIAIGLSLLSGNGVGITMVAAVFLSNIPESLSASTGLRKDGRSPAYILVLWSGVMLASTMSAALGYGLLGEASGNVIAVIQAFAAGAILTMLADTMMPEAFEHGGSVVGLLTVLGFASAFLLSII